MPCLDCYAGLIGGRNGQMGLSLAGCCGRVVGTESEERWSGFSRWEMGSSLYVEPQRSKGSYPARAFPFC